MVFKNVFVLLLCCMVNLSKCEDKSFLISGTFEKLVKNRELKKKELYLTIDDQIHGKKDEKYINFLKPTDKNKNSKPNCKNSTKSKSIWRDGSLSLQETVIKQLQHHKIKTTLHDLLSSGFMKTEENNNGVRRSNKPPKTRKLRQNQKPVRRSGSLSEGSSSTSDSESAECSDFSTSDTDANTGMKCGFGIGRDPSLGDGAFSVLLDGLNEKVVV